MLIFLLGKPRQLLRNREIPIVEQSGGTFRFLFWSALPLTPTCLSVVNAGIKRDSQLGVPKQSALLSVFSRENRQGGPTQEWGFGRHCAHTGDRVEATVRSEHNRKGPWGPAGLPLTAPRGPGTERGGREGGAGATPLST